jgi:hypothetical protein
MAERMMASTAATAVLDGFFIVHPFFFDVFCNR